MLINRVSWGNYASEIFLDLRVLAMTTAYLSLFGYPSKSCSLNKAEMVSRVKSAKLNSSFLPTLLPQLTPWLVY